MKYYECDMCGRIATSHRFKEENWETTYFDADGVEIVWEYDEKLDYYYCNTPVVNTYHLCPLCSTLYHDIYRPFMPRRN